MAPHEFKRRYIASLPHLPPGVELHLDEFVVYSEEDVFKLSIPDADKELLTKCGLPRDVAPFLSFGLTPADRLRPFSEVYGLPESFGRYRMVGHNSSGDMICLDEATFGRVVYLNHDRGMEVVFMNSSVLALAECLCAFGEFMLDRDPEACREKIRKADPPAMEPGSFWPGEINTEAVVQR